ncbi:MAG: hypothetical protein KatS3mg131_2734 [Candidatus Tectimicrobiota bacterium]|nr:MAG: hypothetical protein KatS3mg131_2734 [Candidatus Tectomicrobia bacterium]
MNAAEPLLRADVYRLLALGFAHPSPERLQALAALLEELLAAALPSPLRLPLQALQAALAASSQPEVEGAYHRLFATTVAVPPCESSYSREDKGALLLDVSGFYRAFGLAAGRAQEPPDSIGHELEFMGILALKEALARQQGRAEAVDVTVAAQRDFLQEHLGRWYAALAARLQAASPLPFYQALAALLAAWGQAELARYGLQPQPLTSALPLVETETLSCPLAAPQS